MKTQANKKQLKNTKSITFTLFFIIFGAIMAVLACGYLLINFLAPTIYCNFIMRKIESNVEKALEMYDGDISDANFMSNIPLPYDQNEMFENIQNKKPINIRDYRDIAQLIKDSRNESLVVYKLATLAMSNSADIEILDGETLLYTSPRWFAQAMSDTLFITKPAKQPRNARLYLFSGSGNNDENWINRSVELNIEGDYTLNVRLYIKSFLDNIKIIKLVFLYLILVGIFLAIICALILSTIVTRPLKKLRNIALEMENMNFTMRYENVGRNDEIGQLGRTLNHMMDRLGTTIEQLQGEVDKEKQTDMLRREFVAQVSHELKTPIAIISNYAEALQDEIAESPEETSKYYSIIDNECRKMSHIINDLLDLSQMESGSFTIQNESFDIMNLLNNIGDKYREIATGDITITKDIDKDSAYIIGDSIRIEQAVENLMTNALKHTKDTGSIILNSHTEGNMVHISVENTGANIPSEILPHIWDSFTKGNDEKGTGLGLSIVSNIIKLHNGEHYVRNTKDGVVFGVRLPVVSSK